MFHCCLSISFLSKLPALVCFLFVVPSLALNLIFRWINQILVGITYNSVWGLLHKRGLEPFIWNVFYLCLLYGCFWQLWMKKSRFSCISCGESVEFFCSPGIVVRVIRWSCMFPSFHSFVLCCPVSRDSNTRFLYEGLMWHLLCLK